MRSQNIWNDNIVWLLQGQQQSSFSNCADEPPIKSTQKTLNARRCSTEMSLTGISLILSQFSYFSLTWIFCNKIHKKKSIEYENGTSE